MTIATLALRLITVAALTGATRAGSAVSDSQLGADQRENGLAVAVHVDGSALQGGMPEAARQGEGSATLVIELAYLVAVDGVGNWSSPPAEAVLEARLDLLEREICAVLLNGEGVWPDLWRRCVLGHVGYEMRRGEANLANGVRFAGREVVLKLRVLAEPPLGEAPSGFWADFLAAVAASDALAPLSDDLTAGISGVPLPAWRQAQADLGVARETVDAMGVAPPFPTDEEAPPAIEIRVIGEDEARVIGE